jgi:hypothetical protein
LKTSGGWKINRLSLTEIAEDKVIGSAHWMGADGAPTESSPVVITFRDGKIRDMQACGSRRDAERFARRGWAKATRAGTRERRARAKHREALIGRLFDGYAARPGGRPNSRSYTAGSSCLPRKGGLPWRYAVVQVLGRGFLSRPLLPLLFLFSFFC